MNSGSAWPVHHCVSSQFYTRWIRRKKPLYRRVIFYCLYCDSQVSVTISIPLLYFFCLECSSSSMVWFPQGGTSCARSLGWAAVPLPTEQWILFCVQEGNCTWQHCSFPPKRWFSVQVKIPYSVCCFQVLHCTHLWCWDGFGCVCLPAGPGSWCSPAQWSICITSVAADVQICVFHTT